MNNTKTVNSRPTQPAPTSHISEPVREALKDQPESVGQARWRIARRGRESRRGSRGRREAQSQLAAARAEHAECLRTSRAEYEAKLKSELTQHHFECGSAMEEVRQIRAETDRLNARASGTPRQLRS